MKRIISFLVLAVFILGTGTLCGCSKDSIIGMFNSIVMSLGDNSLTKNEDLHGTRTFGKDTYTGSYDLICEDASFRERLFGNTSVEREDGYTLHITADFDGSEGSAALYLKEGFQDEEKLFSGPGIHDEEIEIGPGSDYFILETDHFTGNITLVIE